MINIKLFKYMSSAGIDVIQNLRVLVQNPNNFNDPFELSAGVTDLELEEFRNCFMREYGTKFYQKNKEKFPNESESAFKERMLGDEKELRSLCENLPKEMHQEFFKFREGWGRDKCGLICFSSTEVSSSDEILLWSHYADSHKGVRIYFDLNQFKVKSKSVYPVDYCAIRPLLNPLVPIEKQERIFSNLTVSKSDIWEYEKEYRWLISYRECFSEFDGVGIKHNYIEIEPESIIGVDLGLAMSAEVKDAFKVCLKRSFFKHVQLRETCHDRKKYSLVYNIVKLCN